MLTNMDLESDGSERNVWLTVIKAAESGKVVEGLELVKAASPRHYATDYKKLRGNLEEIKQDAKKTSIRLYGVKTFDVPEEVEK